MRASLKRVSVAALAGLALAALAPPASAQFGRAMNSPAFQVNPNMFNFGQNLAYLGRVSAQLPGANPYGNPYLSTYSPLAGYSAAASLTSNPYATSPGLANSYGGGGYQSPYLNNPYIINYPDPYGGYFTGTANLVGAYGKYEIDVNKARLLNQQVEQAKIDTRRRLFDEWRYERMHMPTAEDLRVARIERDLARARRQPPLTEVLSGKSLNDLLSHLKAVQAKGGQQGNELRLDEEMLKKINVAPDGSAGNLGLLKREQAGSKLAWPAPLRGEAFNTLRKDFAADADDAINRARINGKVDEELMKKLTADLQGLNDALEKNVVDLSPGQYIDAKRFLNLLGDAVRALQDANVAKYFDRTYEARGKTVEDLVKYMSRRGLSFKSATPGDEAAYRALYTLLAAYDASMTRLARNE